mmetsp:Transcript_10051/g.39131  ORF Transcript_10051/g.39131 Transcript_10051/m.39131 type:complete len:236 (-) Transcript_10051:1288-1995(-)
MAWLRDASLPSLPGLMVRAASWPARSRASAASASAALRVVSTTWATVSRLPSAAALERVASALAARRRASDAAWWAMAASSAPWRRSEASCSSSARCFASSASCFFTTMAAWASWAALALATGAAFSVASSAASWATSSAFSLISAFLAAASRAARLRLHCSPQKRRRSHSCWHLARAITSGSSRPASSASSTVIRAHGQERSSPEAPSGPTLMARRATVRTRSKRAAVTCLARS